MTNADHSSPLLPLAPGEQTACFAVHASADPGLLPRVAGLWAKRGLMPARWHSAVCGQGDREVYIDLEMPGLTVALAQQIAAELRQIWGVSQVLMTLDGERGTR